jgi:hypothetical protein
MGVIEEVPNVVGNAVSWFLDKRGALIVTRSHLGQMRDDVETALLKKRWPSGARTERWESVWSRNGKMLSRTMKSDTFAVVEEVYGFADDFGRGLEPGERDFDATAQHPGDDEHFFARYLEALDRADAVLRVHQK